MKKIIFLFLSIFFCSSVFAKKVKFSVDMDTFTVSPNGVHITGDFQAAAGFFGGNWTSNGTLCSQEGTSNIYSVIVDIPAFSKYEYKFINGDQFYEVEFVPEKSRVGYDGNDNRWLWVDSISNDTSFSGAIKFSGNAPAGLFLVRFMVDLRNQNLISSLPHIAGNFQNWNPSSISLYSFADSIFEIIRYLDSGMYQFKFINGNAWGTDEIIPAACQMNGNRYLTLSGDTILPPYCFATCGACAFIGIAEQELKYNFTISPNPASDFIDLHFNNQANIQNVSIFDSSGKQIKEIAINAQNRIDITGIPDGLYYLTCTQDFEKSFSRKLIINRSKN